MFYLDMKLINLFHVLLISPFLFYIGYQKNKTEDLVYNLLGIFSTILIILYVPFPTSFHFSYWNLIKILHWFLILPTFLYIAYKKKMTKK